MKHLDLKTEILFWLKSFGLSILAFFTPAIPMILLVGAFIAVDTVIGIYKAYKRGEAITSRKLSAVISKTFLYQGALLLSFCIDSVFGVTLFGVEYLVSKLLMSTLIFIEAKSIDENWKIITGVSIFKNFKEMLKRAAVVKKEVEDLVTPSEDEE